MRERENPTILLYIRT